MSLEGFGFGALVRGIRAESSWFEAPIQRGQIQYLNNIHVAHYRSEFFDSPGGVNGRHLIRTWHRANGSTGYDG